jgi:hypothetical protein
MRIQDVIPVKIRKQLLTFHQSLLWKKSFNNFQKAIDKGEIPSKQVIKKLIYSWGNQGFSAQTDYLETCIKYTLSTKGNIIECGSGLSTLVIGYIAKVQNRKMISFEHIDVWAKRVQENSDNFNLVNNTIYVRKLKNYGDFDWYDISNIDLSTYDLAICDAPPSNTKGGRRGFIHLFKERLVKNAIILVDDTIREDEQQMIEEWKKILDIEVNFYGTFDPHAVIRIK